MKPDRIGPYRIQEIVAEDALTVTYRAEDPGLGRTLLLKTARAAVPPAALRERLAREAKILAPLAHPAIVALYGFVRKDDAVVLLFEDVRGPRLDQVLARAKSLPLPQALAIACGITSALAHMHARGIVHGGLRPDRVALTAEGPRLMDFSTAHPVGAAIAEGEDEPQLLPEYMAPEQILSEAAGPRADVFSAGVVLFELLTGRRPFDVVPVKPVVRTDVLAPAIPVTTDRRDALAHRIRNAPPPPLTTTEGAPPELVARIVSRCLAKDPADRYADAGALAEELADALREASTEPAGTLATRALAAADFVPALPPAPARPEAELAPQRDALARLLPRLAALFGLILLGALVTEASRAGERPAPPPSETPPGARGYLRVLAQPWAEVVVDGEAIDTTPMARPIAVAPGRHFVTFVHPNAPEEKRTVNVVAGQTVLVDVTMRIDRPQKDAGPSTRPDDDSP